MGKIRNRRPQVLLLGNGLIRGFSELALSWKELVRKLSTDPSVPEEINMPLPMEIVLRTQDHVNIVLDEHKGELYGCVEENDFKDILTRILTIGFDDILTTNYSYELEEVSKGITCISDRELETLRKRTGECSGSELHLHEHCALHSYNETNCNGVKNRIWHIHGEAAIPESIVIGHYYYGNLLYKCQEMIRRKRNMYEGGTPDLCESWVDSFLTGDVYALGFGFDFSEMDLWWLLSQKHCLPSEISGSFYMYRPEKNSYDVKTALMRTYDVIFENCGMKDISKDDPDRDDLFRTFYDLAIEDMRRKIEDVINLTH